MYVTGRAMKKGLFLGAGFSYDLGMPLASELTETFLNMFTPRDVGALGLILSSKEPFGKDRPINKQAITAGLNLLLEYKEQNTKNYEALLADLESLKGIENPIQSDRDSSHFLFGIFYGIVDKLFCLYQQASYEIVYGRNLGWFRDLKNLLSDKETWVFSLNHDLCVEYLALDLGIPISYGDTGKITFPISNLDLGRCIEFTSSMRSAYAMTGEGFFHDAFGINLVKLHGGLSELEYEDRSIICNLRLDRRSSKELAEEFALSEEMTYFQNGIKILSGRDRWITSAQGELDLVSRSMLMGGRKYSGTLKLQLGEEKLKLLDDVLRDLDELTIIGYGFGDRHVNFRLSNAMSLSEKLKIVIVDPYLREVPECIRHFDYDSRIRRAMCGAPHWMSYCKTEKWDYAQLTGLKENLEYRQEVHQRVRNRLQGI